MQADVAWGWTSRRLPGLPAHTGPTDHPTSTPPQLAPDLPSLALPVPSLGGVMGHLFLGLQGPAIAAVMVHSGNQPLFHIHRPSDTDLRLCCCEHTWTQSQDTSGRALAPEGWLDPVDAGPGCGLAQGDSAFCRVELGQHRPSRQALSRKEAGPEVKVEEGKRHGQGHLGLTALFLIPCLCRRMCVDPCVYIRESCV